MGFHYILNPPRILYVLTDTLHVKHSLATGKILPHARTHARTHTNTQRQY